MTENNLIRQRDILPPEKTLMPITIIGAGAIGSQVALCLAKMGFKDLVVYDFDEVSEENISNQWYGPSDIGDFKVTCLAALIEQMTGTQISAMEVPYDLESVDSGDEIIISAVDSMEARKTIFNRAMSLFKGRYLIDPRMSAEEGQIYTVDLLSPLAVAEYEKTLFPDAEGVQEACTAKATMYTSMLLGGQVAKQVKDIAVGDPFAHTIFWSIKKNDIVFFK